MKTKSIITIAITTMFFLNSCNSSSNTEENVETSEKSENVESSITNTSLETPVSKEIECFGDVTVPQNSIFEYYSKSNGYVSDLNLMVGDKVKSNEFLIQIESPEFAIFQQKLQEAKTNYEWILKTKDRNEKLFATQSISQKEYEESIKEYDMALSKLSNEEQYISEMGFQPKDFINSISTKLKLKSKNKGTVTEINIKNGSKVTPDTHLFTIIDDASKIIEINIPASNFESIDENSEFYFLQNKDTVWLNLINKSNFIDMNNNVKIFAKPNSDENQLLIGQKLLIKIRPSKK